MHTQYNKILVVAANHDVRENIGSSVSAWGGKAVFADNCDHALNMMIEYMDAVVYLPQPGKCSLQAMDRIKARSVNGKILFATEKDVCTPSGLTNLLKATEATTAVPSVNKSGVFNAARYSLAASF